MKKGKIILIILALTIVVNIISLNYLPDKVGLQIRTNGELGNYLPKPMFLFVAPLILLVVYIMQRNESENQTIKNVVISLLIFIANLFSIYMNLRG